MSKPNVAAVVLAAGGSTRFGEPKQLLTWRGRPLVVHVADVAWAAGLNPIVVVTGAHAGDVAPLFTGRITEAGAADQSELRLIHNYRWQEGMSSSIFAGLAALPAEVDAALFLLIDQPLVTPDLLRRLIRRWEESDAGIVVPTGDGKRGTPVLFEREFFPELARLSGDVGGRMLFDRHPDRILHVPVDNPQALADADTPERFTQLKEQSEGRQTPEEILAGVRAVVADMDGVLWRHQSPLPGLKPFFELLESRELDYVLVTNNSSSTPAQYREKLASLGVTTTEDHILTSALATAGYLAERADPGTPVYVIGGAGIRTALRERGFTLTEGEAADYVVVGWDRELTWQKLATATRLIRRGATFVSTNPDRTFPMEDYQAPGNGAQTVAIEAATGERPVYVGKPSPILYRQALERTGTAPEETLMIGDRLDTDILGGMRLGMPTALLLSGVSQEAELADSPVHPGMVFADLAKLVHAWPKKGPKEG